jgi:hypothetical protein
MIQRSCPRCNGSGKINDGGSLAFPIERTCPACKGRGEIESGPKGDLETYAKEQTKRETFKELINQKEVLPCAYGAGDVIMSYWYLEGGEEDIRKVCICMKARQIKDSWFGKNENREKELSKMGCPEPSHRFFSGWRCRYADGNIHSF